MIISPERGKTVEIGKRLLELADSPRDVQWVTWPAPGGFAVPLELFNLFDADGEQPEAAEEEAPKRRRGRPRKEESTDNDTSEEE